MSEETDEKILREELERGRDVLLFWTPVRINNAKKLSMAPEDRTLALGKFRMYIFKKKQLRISQHIADLQRIKATEPVNEVWLYFKAATLVIRTPKADVMMAHLQQIHRYCFPASPLKVEVSPPSKIAEIPELEAQPAGNFHDTYRSICNYLDVPLREDIYWDIKNIFPANDIKTLNVREFDLLDPQDFKALVLSLHYNGSYFTGLVAKNFRLSSTQLQIICDLMSHASYLEVLVLARNGPACKDAGLALLSEAFLRNKQLSLRTINISENGVDDKGCRSFGKALALCIGDSLRKLKLSGWSAVSGKAWQAFFSDLKANTKLSGSLTRLDLSNNKLTDEASLSLSSFLSLTHRLERLNLSNSGVNLETICDALPLGCANLTELVLAGNRFNPKKDLYHLVSFLSSSSKLTLFDASATQLGIEPLKQILRAIAGNLALQALTLRLSENKLGALAANLIAHMAADFVNIECLDLTDTDLGDEGVAYLTEGLVKNKCIRSLKIGKNMRQRTKYRAVAIKNVIGLIESPCPLIALSLEGGKSDLQLREDIAPLLLALGSNESLASLDISGHAFGNFGAAILGKSLQVNCVLKRLWMDENAVTLQGFQMLAVALERNDSLHFLPTPILDISAALRTGEDAKALTKAMLDIERAIFVNLEGRQAAGLSDAALPVPEPLSNRKSGALMQSAQDILARPEVGNQRKSKSLKNMSPDALRASGSISPPPSPKQPPSPSPTSPSRRGPEIKVAASPAGEPAHPRRLGSSVVRYDPLTESVSKSHSRVSKRPPSVRNNGKKIPMRPGPSTAGVDGEVVLLPDLNPGFASPRPNIARGADKLYAPPEQKNKLAEDDDV